LGNFLGNSQKAIINIVFLDAIFEMPYYAEFLKEILFDKWRLEEHVMVSFTEECSAILQNNLPPQLEDLGSFLYLIQLGMPQLVELCVTLE